MILKKKDINNSTVSISSTNCKNLVGNHPFALASHLLFIREKIAYLKHPLFFSSSSSVFFNWPIYFHSPPVPPNQFHHPNHHHLIFEMAFHLSPSKKALVLSETHSAAQEKGLLPLPPSRRLSRSRHSWVDKQRIGTVVVASPAFRSNEAKGPGNKDGNKEFGNKLYIHRAQHSLTSVPLVQDDGAQVPGYRHRHRLGYTRSKCLRWHELWAYPRLGTYSYSTSSSSFHSKQHHPNSAFEWKRYV